MSNGTDVSVQEAEAMLKRLFVVAEILAKNASKKRRTKKRAQKSAQETR